MTNMSVFLYNNLTLYYPCLQEDHENILRSRESGKGVLTAPFRLLKSNRLGVILTFAVYSTELPSNATPADRIRVAIG